MTITNLVLALQIVSTNLVFLYDKNDVFVEHLPKEKIEYVVLGSVPVGEQQRAIGVNTHRLARGVDKIWKGVDNAPALIPFASYHIDEEDRLFFDSKYCGVLFKKDLLEAIKASNERSNELFERKMRLRKLLQEDVLNRKFNTKNTEEWE